MCLKTDWRQYRFSPVTDINGGAVGDSLQTAEYPVKNALSRVGLPENPVITILQFLDGHVGRLKYNVARMILRPVPINNTSIPLHPFIPARPGKGRENVKLGDGNSCS